MEAHATVILVGFANSGYVWLFSRALTRTLTGHAVVHAGSSIVVPVVWSRPLDCAIEVKNLRTVFQARLFMRYDHDGFFS